MKVDFAPLFVVLDELGDDFGDVFEVEDVDIDLFFLLLFGWLLRLQHKIISFISTII